MSKGHVVCAVPGCEAWKGGVGGKVFLPPRDRKRASVWEEAVRKFFPTFPGFAPYTGVCSTHFAPECIMQVGGGKIGRSDNAVPSVFVAAQLRQLSPCASAGTGGGGSVKLLQIALREIEDSLRDSSLTEEVRLKLGRARDCLKQATTSEATIPPPANPVVPGAPGAWQAWTGPTSLMTPRAKASSSRVEVTRAERHDASTSPTRPRGIGMLAPQRQSVKTQTKIYRRSVNLQVDTTRTPRPQVRDQGTQCVGQQLPRLSHLQSPTASASTTSLTYSDDLGDLDYAPSQSTASQESNDQDQNDGARNKGRKYFVVEEAHLLSLLRRCPTCSRSVKLELKPVGTMVVASRHCGRCGELEQWRSQSSFGTIPSYNLMLSCGIMFSGICIDQALRCLAFTGLEVYGRRTFHEHQERYLRASIRTLYKEEQARVLAERKGRALHVGGDARCDTPGFSAKYCVYYTMDLETSVVLDTQVVQCNEVGGSTHMELAGCERSLQFLIGDSKLEVNTFVTDGHSGIEKWLPTKYPSVIHKKDSWHVVKCVRKRLHAAGMRANGELILLWERSLTRQLMWCAQTTPSGDGPVILAKFDATLAHIQNIHVHEDQRFPKCLHGEYDQAKIWVDPGTHTHYCLQKIWEEPVVRKMVSEMSPRYQTSAIENLNSQTNHFMPKLLVYSNKGMQARAELVVLHHNENVARPVLKDKTTGEKRTAVWWRKWQHGDQASVRLVKGPTTYAYVDRLKEEVVRRVTGRIREDIAETAGTITSSFKNRRPNQEAAADYLARRNKYQPSQVPASQAQPLVPSTSRGGSSSQPQ